VDYIGLEV